MKLQNPLGASLALAITLGPLVPALHAQSQTQAPSVQQSPQKNQTFVGEVVKLKDGRVALLTDPKNGRGAYLDDQKKATPFEGKVAKVTGTLDSSTHIIHVQKIEPE